MSSFNFRPASRQQAKPLIGLYSESGAGKTYTSLLLARGYVGQQGRIAMIETESGRGESYADPREYPELAGPGGSNYDVLPLRDDFSPENYGHAIEAAEKAKYDALIIDSASHEWEGAGGVLDMAAQNQEKGKKGPLVWQQPKIDHQRHFMLKFMQCPIPLVILNMRAKYPMEERVKDGKKEWARSESLEPKQSEDILYEMFLHGYISRDDHAFHITKCTNKSLRDVFLDGKVIDLSTGRRLAEWAKGTPAGPVYILKTTNQTGTFKTPAEWKAKALAILDKLTDQAQFDKFKELNFDALNHINAADVVAAQEVENRIKKGPVAP